MIARISALLLAMTSIANASSLENLMPVPANVKPVDGALPVNADFTIAIEGTGDPRVSAAVDRMLARWGARTGLAFRKDAKPLVAIRWNQPAPPIPTLGEDESYALEITPTGASIDAPNSTGALRALATLEQLLDANTDGWFLPAAKIEDAPRFPWRGLMLDVCRHWQPMEVVKRTLDGMAAVKMNVLHFHVTEDQGFRIESKTHPELHEQGSDGNFFTQEEVREIIAYAAERGIRVVPEFDLPGHATSWLVSHPEIGSKSGNYAIERRWGIFEPTLDPTNEQTYALLDDFLGEMAALFPDPFLHIGGDEVEGSQWKESAAIQAFMREHGLESNADLQAHFNSRIQQILAKNGKRMIGWDEILHPELPKTAAIQSWRGIDSLVAAAKQGYSGILSNGYYIDLCHPTADHYLNDPLPPDVDLTDEEAARILGGEATMWAEWVTPETIDSRIWPRTAAIAERLWSPREVRDLDDMHRRLAVTSRRLEELGLSHVSSIDPMLRRFAGDSATPADLQNLRLVSDIVEPVKGYRRGKQQPHANQLTPLTGFVDAARPDSALSRALVRQIDDALFSGRSIQPVVETLTLWKAAADALRINDSSPRVAAMKPLFDRLSAVCAIGLEAAPEVESGTKDAAWRQAQLSTLDTLSEPHDACELPFLPAIRRLVVATSLPRQDIPPAQWREQVEALSTPAAAKR